MRPTIHAAIHAARLVGAIRVAQRGDEHAVRILRIHGHRGDLLRIGQPAVRPCGATVVRAIHAITHRQVRALQSLTRADVDRARGGRRHRECADGPGGLVVEDRLPGSAGVGRPPHAAVVHAHEEGVRLPRDRSRGHGATTAEWTDAAPMQVLHHAGIELGMGRGSGHECRAEKREPRVRGTGPRHGRLQGCDDAQGHQGRDRSARRACCRPGAVGFRSSPRSMAASAPVRSPDEIRMRASRS